MFYNTEIDNKRFKLNNQIFELEEKHRSLEARLSKKGTWESRKADIEEEIEELANKRCALEEELEDIEHEIDCEEGLEDEFTALTYQIDDLKQELRGLLK